MSRFLILTGPTAVGKTQLSLRLAQRLDAEIISADSRQVYRELTIGTAKPSPEERALVPHHFVHERSVMEPLSAGMFAEQANERIRHILTRGRVPLVVGGSTLYVDALRFGLADIPRVPPGVRATVRQRLEDEGSEALYAELQRLDPASAATMDATKTQRVVRALEVYYGTGHALSSYFDDHPPPPFQYTTVVLTRDRASLHARINRRVDAMLEAGLLAEVARVLEAGISPSLPVMRTIGYREAVAHLQGRLSFAEMLQLIKRNTRRYAKRQLTWFRRTPAMWFAMQ